MSFVGGGSDIAAFYDQHGGAVLSTAIDKYIYVTCNKKFDDGIRVAYSRTEEVNSVADIEHRLVREAMGMLHAQGGLEITTIADVPSRGTGLGSSSSFTVGLLNALYAFRGQHASATLLAEQSCHIEIDRCGEPIGKQDQYAAAFGGLNLFEFHPGGSVDVSPVLLPAARRDAFWRRIIVFYTGVTRSASKLLHAQSEAVSGSATKQAALRRMVALAHVMKRAIEQDQLDDIGDILDENWALKRSLSDAISTSAIDRCYAAARAAGAEGGKLLGAGAGGFLMLFAPEERHSDIATALSGLRRVNFGFEPLGSRIIFFGQ